MSSARDAIPKAEHIAGCLGADSVLIFGVDGQNLDVADLWPAHPAAKVLRLQVGFGVTGRVARTGETVVLSDDSPRNPTHREILGLGESHTVTRMCLPLFGFEQRLVGVLAVYRRSARPFGRSNLAAAEQFAPLLGLGLHAEQLWSAAGAHRTERERLVKQAISAQEAERRRIAYDLHDGVTTALASLSFHVSAADLSVSELSRPSIRDDSHLLLVDRARAELADASDLIGQAYHQTRAAISGLHSLVLDDLGLVAALESLARPPRGGGGGPVIDVVVDPDARIDEIPDYAATALYRIAQEALSNARKYSGAGQVVLSLRRVGESLLFGCSDDGAGFDPEQRRRERASEAGTQHFGLTSMAERCAFIDASLQIDSAPGRGTNVLVEVPL